MNQQVLIRALNLLAFRLVQYSTGDDQDSLKVPASPLDNLGEVIALGHLDLAHVDQDKVRSLGQSEAQAKLFKVGAEDISSLLVGLDLILKESLLSGEFQALGDGLL